MCPSAATVLRSGRGARAERPGVGARRGASRAWKEDQASGPSQGRVQCSPPFHRPGGHRARYVCVWLHLHRRRLRDRGSGQSDRVLPDPRGAPAPYRFPAARAGAPGTAMLVAWRGTGARGGACRVNLRRRRLATGMALAVSRSHLPSQVYSPNTFIDNRLHGWLQGGTEADTLVVERAL